MRPQDISLYQLILVRFVTNLSIHSVYLFSNSSQIINQTNLVEEVNEIQGQLQPSLQLEIESEKEWLNSLQGFVNQGIYQSMNYNLPIHCLNNHYSMPFI